MHTCSRRLSPTDTDYPIAPWQLPHVVDWADAPPPLYVRGNPAGFALTPSVAIVGTRKATTPARRYAERLAAACARAGWVVASGGALGIDAAAHRGALSAGGATTLVTAGGVDVPTPRNHAGLFAAATTVASFEPDGTTPLTYRFLKRNWLLGALTRATVVVQESRRGGGSRHMAAVTRRLDHPLFVVPQAPWCEPGYGSLLELLRGAQLVLDVDDAITQLTPIMRANTTLAQRAARAAMRRGLAPRTTAAEDDQLVDSAPGPLVRTVEPAREPPSGDAATVLAALADTPAHLDEICLRTGLGCGAVSTALLRLRLEGHDEAVSASCYRRLR